MSTITLKRPAEKKLPSISKRDQLVEIAERDSLRRDFEIVRKMHGLPPKQNPAEDTVEDTNGER